MIPSWMDPIGEKRRCEDDQDRVFVCRKILKRDQYWEF